MSGPAFRQFVLKVHSRCNLACDYCYVYEAADQNWRNQPKAISNSTVRTAGQRIAAHAAEHHLDRVRVTLHGGEPLLVGLPGLERIVSELRSAIQGPTQLDLGLQTNGVLLDEDIARFLLREGVRVGISLDGGRTANDRHRRFTHGGSSYDSVVAAIRLMSSPPFRPIFAGILATIDPRNDPVQVFQDLAGLEPGRLDLLLPHATWECPPAAAEPGRTVYGDWLVAFFDAWYDAPPVVGVRLFQEIMHTLLGGASTSEAVGLSSPESIVIETDGSFERTDALKIAYHGAPATGYDIFRHSLQDVLQHPAIVAGMRGRAVLAKVCQSCPIVASCGGGLYPHRYRATNGFDNPSVYCHDLGRLINHVQRRLTVDLRRHESLATIR